MKSEKERTERMRTKSGEQNGTTELAIGKETCGRKNPYDEEYYAASKEVHDKYGFLGEKLQK